MKVVSAHFFKQWALHKRDCLNADVPAGSRHYYWTERSPTRRFRRWEVKTNKIG